ncbi:hypothetical protein D3C84_1061570 [compost metagenome]
MKQLKEVANHSLNRFPFEQSGGICQTPLQTVRILRQRQRQINFHCASVRLHRLNVKSFG